MNIGRITAWMYLVTLLFSNAVFSQESTESTLPPQAVARVMHLPTLIPDRILLSWTQDPATTQAVNWRTSTVVKKAYAQIALAGDGPSFPEKAKTITATTQSLRTDLNTAHFHTAEFVELQPNTKYAYRVGDQVNWSEWFQFTTAASDAQPFSFIYFGDAQNNIKSMWSRVIREAYGDQPDASFMLHAGDLVNRGNSDAEWGQWCAAGSWLNAMLPSLAIPGNHEQTRRSDRTQGVTEHWRPQFAFPLNGPPGLAETCYTLVYQGVRLIALDSNQKLAEQATWLGKVLANNDCQWVISSFRSSRLMAIDWTSKLVPRRASCTIHLPWLNNQATSTS